ncbi:hypothetical protein BV20DRAFT_680818 [Pilatotrama ljubarskyi]|nr:hypothetical protein BV20DRAFT_680818 [Pilatotrama ljubarskyi]
MCVLADGGVSSQNGIGGRFAIAPGRGSPLGRKTALGEEDETPLPVAACHPELVSHPRLPFRAEGVGKQEHRWALSPGMAILSDGAARSHRPDFAPCFRIGSAKPDVLVRSLGIPTSHSHASLIPGCLSACPSTRSGTTSVHHAQKHIAAQEPCLRTSRPSAPRNSPLTAAHRVVLVGKCGCHCGAFENVGREMVVHPIGGCRRRRRRRSAAPLPHCALPYMGARLGVVSHNCATIADAATDAVVASSGQWGATISRP